MNKTTESILAELSTDHPFHEVAKVVLREIKNLMLEGVAGERTSVDAVSLGNILAKRSKHLCKIGSAYDGLTQISDVLRAAGKGRVDVEQHSDKSKVVTAVLQNGGLIGCFYVKHASDA